MRVVGRVQRVRARAPPGQHGGGIDVERTQERRQRRESADALAPCVASTGLALRPPCRIVRVFMLSLPVANNASGSLPDACSIATGCLKQCAPARSVAGLRYVANTFVSLSGALRRSISRASFVPRHLQVAKLVEVAGIDRYRRQRGLNVTARPNSTSRSSIVDGRLLRGRRRLHPLRVAARRRHSAGHGADLPDVWLAIRRHDRPPAGHTELRIDTFAVEVVGWRVHGL